MRRALHALSFASLLAFAPACDSTDSEDNSELFRNALDVNVQMTMADGGDDDGSILWEIVETEVYTGPAADGVLLLYIQDDAIFSAESGQQTCTVNAPFLNSNMVEVIAANGTDVLFTIWNNYVFEGKVNVKIENFGQMKKQFGDQLLFEYEPTSIYLGEAIDGFLLMTTDADITVQSQGRQLLIAALMTGECGGTGLPGYNL